jgi:hypothetical protein
VGLCLSGFHWSLILNKLIGVYILRPVIRQQTTAAGGGHLIGGYGEKSINLSGNCSRNNFYATLFLEFEWR